MNRILGSGIRRRRPVWVVALTALAVVASGAPMVTAMRGSNTADRPVVVWGSSPADAAQSVEDAGGEVENDLEVIGGVTARLTDRQVVRLRGKGLQVAEDSPMAVAGQDFTPVPVTDHQLLAINPPQEWNLDAGAGVGVALIDTGVTEVEDLRDRVVHGPDLSGEGTTTDSYGHGTFMAGLIAGNGALSADGTSRHLGVAPGAHIVSVKVAGAGGDTTLGRVLDGIGWAIENSERYGIRVMNLSVAVPPVSSSYRADPLSAAVEAAWSSGITVVAAAGNEGSYVSSPGRDPWVITVGALDTGATLGAEDDSVPGWSGRETTRWTTKPEVLAPGVSVASLAAPGSTVVKEFPGSVVEDHYFVGSGTSMAAALTSGAVAVLTEHHSAATPDDFKSALVSSGRPVAGELGRAIDLTAANMSTAGSPDDWWQRFPIAFDGLGVGLHDRMPWAEAGSEPEYAAWVANRWAGAKWAGAKWAGAKWAGAKWAGAKWAGAKWAGAKWAGGPAA